MCDTMVQVGADGVRLAKNSDRDPNEAQLLEWHPARVHPAGSTVRCTELEIPQAPRTHAVLLSRPFWMWGAEMGANEHGVVIGNEAVFTDQPYADTGLLGMDLLRLALERASTAESAVEVLVVLLERYGQGGGCGHEDRSFTYHNSFLVADPGGAVVLETAGRRWATEVVRGGGRAISNGLTIPAFARAHRDRLRSTVAACDVRRAVTEPAAAAAAGAGDLARVLRRHEGGRTAPRYSPLNGAMAAPCMHAGGLAASSQTTASWISELTGDGPRHWATGTAAPCTGIFLPVRVDEPVDLGPPATDVADEASWWWQHERLHRQVVRDPARLLPRYLAERDDLERAWFAAPPPPQTAVDEVARRRERWRSRVERDGPHRDTRPAWVRRYWSLRDRRAGLASPVRPAAAAG
jgi:secernin